MEADACNAGHGRLRRTAHGAGHTNSEQRHFRRTCRAGRHSRTRLDEAVRVWTRIALLSFGGPAGQIAVMHRILVDELRWISDVRFLHALNYCHLLDRKSVV